MILIRFALHLAVQGHLLENGRFPPPPPNQGSIFIATFSIYKFGKPEEGWYGQPKLPVVLISKIERFNWLSQSWSEQRVLFFILFFSVFLLFFFSIFRLAMGEGGGGGARRFHPGGFIFSWPQVSIKGIPQYMTGREFRRLGFFKDLWLIFSEMHIMAVSFLSFLLDKVCEGSIVFKNETQTAFINTEIFRFSYDSDILLRSRFLDVTQLQRNVGGTLRDIQKTAGRCINR